MTVEFVPWAKTSRFFRDIVVTEKIDGTNAAIGIEKVESDDVWGIDSNVTNYVKYKGDVYKLWAQSRSRIITPGKSTDNYGFAGWVNAHAYELVKFLGEGLHFGEWWGSGIQRGYGLHKGEKYFSLFNTHRFADIEAVSDGLVRSAPVLYEGVMDTAEIANALRDLKALGSFAQMKFNNPEGICIYHTTSRIIQKVTLDNNDQGKWENQILS